MRLLASERQLSMFVPEIVTTLKGYTRRQLIADLQAGVIVGIVALPLAIAFAIASGVTPDRGLYTAIASASGFPMRRRTRRARVACSG